MSNGNDLRIFYNKPGDCQGREIDRIVENMGTSKAMVLFKLQEEIGKNITETSSYFLAYGNQYARGAKENPNNVYLFYDDFSDASLGKWYRNWASTAAINGKLEMKTGQTPTGDNGEVAIFVKDGEEWKDIEVELDMMEKNNDKYPGPFLRIEDARLKSTTAWWFEYHSGSTECTMRPFKNNKDGNWLYKGTLAKPLTVGKWVRVKYRVVSDSFSHWVNGHLIHNNVKVSSTWMIAKGTLGLGCHKVASSSGCHTFYDNIKVTQYVSSQPTVFLSSECKVNVKLLYEFGTSEKNPAWSCKQIHDISLHNGQHRLQNGVYWIKTAADQSVPTYCDLVNGGWTLVGKISGQVGNIYSTWLVKNHHVNRLTNPSLTSTNQMSCIDARYLATYHASTVMLASGENSKGIGGKWVQWSLPANRESKSLWTHAVGLKNVTKLEMLPVMVKAWNGGQKVCTSVHKNLFVTMHIHFIMVCQLIILIYIIMKHTFHQFGCLQFMSL